MNDIRQKTNTSGDGIPDGTESHHEHTISYKIFNLTSSTERVVKLGYCCEPCGIGLPIYILQQEANNYTRYEIGKTGMYEFQDQKYYKKEDDTIDEEDLPLMNIISVRLPYQLQYTKDSTDITQDIVFKLDYVVATG